MPVSFADCTADVIIPKGPGAGWKIPKHYEIRQLIGSGSFGCVCEAEDTNVGRLVAVKRVGRFFDDLVDCKRFLREIAILAHLSHDSVVGLYDLPAPADIDRFDEFYMIMEICDSDLKKLCRMDVVLSQLHVDTLLYNLLVGVKYLHSAGICHCDLKPANCLVNQDCSVKICGFGLSRAIGEGRLHLPELPDTLCQGGTAENSPRGGPVVPRTQRMKRHSAGQVINRWYVSPELILVPGSYTESIDFWAVGCIYGELLGMLEGKRAIDRGPLFPGSSRFPLSPDHNHKTDYRHHTRCGSDQLNAIFDTLGTPTEEQVAALECDDVKGYIKCFSKRKGAGIQSMHTHTSDDAKDMISKLLVFVPQDRISVGAALEHVLFRDIRDPTRETTAADVVRLDEPDLDESLLRRYLGQIFDVYRRT